MRWILALLFTALLIVVVLWPTRQPTTLELKPLASPSAVTDPLADECQDPRLEARRQVIRGSISRVEALLDRYQERRRIQQDVLRLQSRIISLERALEVGASRPVVVQAILQSLDDTIELHKVSSSGAHWKVAGIARNEQVLDSVMRSVTGAIDASVPSMRYVAKARDIGRFYLGFLSPQPKTGALDSALPELTLPPQLPERKSTEGTCWNPLESEELAWRLAEARVAGAMGDDTLVVEKQTLQHLQERMDALQGGMLRDASAIQPTNDGSAVSELLRARAIPAEVTPVGTRLFQGVATQSYRVMSKGEPAMLVKALRTVTKAGAIIGRVELCRLGLRRADLNDSKPDDYDVDCIWSDAIPGGASFAYRYELHVLVREAQVGR